MSVAIAARRSATRRIPVAMRARLVAVRDGVMAVRAMVVEVRALVRAKLRVACRLSMTRRVVPALRCYRCRAQMVHIGGAASTGAVPLAAASAYTECNRPFDGSGSRLDGASARLTSVRQASRTCDSLPACCRSAIARWCLQPRLCQVMNRWWRPCRHAGASSRCVRSRRRHDASGRRSDGAPRRTGRESSGSRRVRSAPCRAQAADSARAVSGVSRAID
jgi:hypothetical protein